VRRLPGASRSRIYAEVHELEQWLKGGAESAAADEPAAAGAPDHPATASKQARRKPPIWAAVAMLAVAAAVLTTVTVGGFRLSWPQPGPSSPAISSQPPSLAAQRLYLAGMDDWSRRTPDGLHRAVDEFTGAIRLSPGYAEAYAGLADSYNLLREYTLMPASQAYPLARKAAKQALALNGQLASAHLALAFVETYWDWDFKSGRREYEKAIALQPSSDLAHHWYATSLSAQGDFDRSLAEFRKARALNPGSLAIQADYGLVLCESGRRQEGLALLLAAEKADPKFFSPHNYLAELYLAQGRDQDYLRESETAASLTDNRQRMAMLQAARAGLAQGGHQGLLRALLAEELRQYQYGAIPAYDVADTYALLGQTDQALSYLQASIERREENVAAISADMAFAPMRSLPRYRMLLARVRPSGEG
jgi:hypothetical protein